MASKKKRTRTTQTRKKKVGVPNERKIVLAIKDAKVRQATQEVFEHYRDMLSTGVDYDDASMLRGFIGGICAMSRVNSLKLSKRQVQELFKSLMVLVAKLSECEHERG